MQENKFTSLIKDSRIHMRCNKHNLYLVSLNLHDLSKCNNKYNSNNYFSCPANYQTCTLNTTIPTSSNIINIHYYKNIRGR